MLTVGLTGGIGSGKSEVARRFVAYGAVLIDADAIAREVVAKGTPGLAAVVAEFGPGVLAADGALDRELLAALVFSDDGARRRLNAIVHPLVGQRSVELLAEAEAADPDAIVVHDVPLLVESGLQGLYDVVVVVVAEAETQVRRLVEKRGMSEADAWARMAAQATDEARLAVADIVIRNDRDLAELDDQVRSAWSDLCARAGRPTLT